MSIAVTSAIEHARSGLIARSSLCLALSGGKDSVVLLTALVQADLPVRAVHVHHGLQSSADGWADFCLDLTRSLGVPCEVKRVQVIKRARRGWEDAAREARYAALWQSVSAGGALLTAHHQRDQAETFLLRLLRGAGVNGLAGMRSAVAYSDNRVLLRPFLSVSYRSIEDYAQAHHLRWVEDPSNHDHQFARNAVRHRLLPALNPQHPEQAIRLIAQACDHLAESVELLSLMAEEDWASIAEGERICSLDKWRSMPWIRAKQVLAWRWQVLSGQAFAQAQWAEIKQQFYLGSGEDRHPLLSWQGWYLLLGAGKLWLLTAEDLADIADLPICVDQAQAWGSWGLLTLSVSPTINTQGWYWRMRQQGDALTHAGRQLHLKIWLQSQKHLPSWQKQRWPVLCSADHQVLTWANYPAREDCLPQVEFSSFLR